MSDFWQTSPRPSLAGGQAYAGQVELALFGVAPIVRARHDYVRKVPKPLDGFLRLIESPHVRVTRRQKAKARDPIWFLLQRLKQHRPGFFKSVGEKVRYANAHERICPLLAWVEAQGTLKMIYRDIRLSCPQPEPRAPLPTQSRVWVEFQAAFKQGNRSVDIFAKVRERVTSTTDRVWVITSDLECPPREVKAIPPTGRRIISPAVHV